MLDRGVRISFILLTIFVDNVVRKRKKLIMNPSFWMSLGRLLEQLLCADNLMVIQNKESDIRETMCQIH